MPSLDNKKPRYWRSVEDFVAGGDRPIASHGYPELVGREFPVGATEMDGPTRRSFLKLLGLTAAGGVAAGCQRNPPERMLPYTRQPADIRPGLPLHYATSMAVDGFGMGLLVTSREGRPIKVEGNPTHPSSFGSSGTYEQAMSYGVYDPQRGKTAKCAGSPSGWKTFVTEVHNRLPDWKKDGGAKVQFLDGPTASPFDAWLRAQVKAQLPNAKFSTYAALARDNVYAGTEMAFGEALEPRHDFDKARVILALDDDFLECGPDRLVNARDFAAHRVPEKPEPNADEVFDAVTKNAREQRAVGGGSDGSAGGGGTGTSPEQWMNRLYVAEANYSTTGAQADHRLRIRGSEIVSLAAAIYAELAPDAAADLATLAGTRKADRWVKAVAKDLAKNGASSVVLAGTRQPAVVHALVAAMNAALKSSVVTYRKPALLDTKASYESLRAIIAAADKGEIETLVVTAYNPIYTAPVDIPIAAALRKIPNVVYAAQFEDETSGFARWYIPAAHELESWGDSANADGVVAIQQPLIAPLFNGVSRAEIFAAFADRSDISTYQLLRESHSTGIVDAASGFDAKWERLVQSGVVDGAVGPGVAVTLRGPAIADAVRAAKVATSARIELNLFVDNKVYDGRFGDNAWLQELPDPLTKVTWGNTAIVSLATAKELGIEAEQIVTLDIGGEKIDAPVFVLPGHADNVVSLAVGYGRQGAEAIARGVGANAYRLRTTTNPWFGANVTLASTGKTDRLGITQEHWAMEGRPIALAADLAEMKEANAKKSKSFRLIEENRGPKPPTMMEDFTEKSGDGYLWGMAIDMSKCTGCNACVLACESENNILIVGKDQVRRGREMHWLRIDRYFEEPKEGAGLADAQVVTQPMACVQCEKAPCEYVCPVNATVHSDEGLNDMVYNRCVGTRYCANNCPYKVRRFNYLNWHNNLQGTLEMAMNPDVTVRSRGVMEKCTYCVQRIEQGRIATRIENHGEGRMLRDGEVVTACQQSCASRAITFGSLHDPNSEVSKKQKDERAYAVLWELNTRPRTRHLAKVRNPNPELV